MKYSFIERGAPLLRTRARFIDLPINRRGIFVWRSRISIRVTSTDKARALPKVYLSVESTWDSREPFAYTLTVSEIGFNDVPMRIFEFDAEDNLLSEQFIDMDGQSSETNGEPPVTIDSLFRRVQPDTLRCWGMYEGSLYSKCAERR